MKVLIVIVVILAIIALAQIMRVYQLSSKLRNKSEAELTSDETNFNSGMLILFLIVFMASSVYLIITYGARPGMGQSGSLHGVEIDWLFDFNWIILLFVFFLTQPILFIFAAKYKAKKGVKATFFSHSNKLELIWTVIPAIVLAFIIIFGLSIWNNITKQKEFYILPTEKYALTQVSHYNNYQKAINEIGDSLNVYKLNDTTYIDYREYAGLERYFTTKEDANEFLKKEERFYKTVYEVQKIEVYAFQFGWVARYAGYDNTLGKADFKVLDPAANPLGVLTTNVIKAKKLEWDTAIINIDKELSDEYLTDEKHGELIAQKNRLTRQIKRLEPLLKAQTKEEDKAANDDLVVKELVLIKGQNYEFKFRSRDVIHSAFFPHFRVQMNCVPGMTTRFNFKPILTTEEMRNDPIIKAKYKRINKVRAEKGELPIEFDYILLCNKICGASHFNMQMKITVVEDKAAYQRWFLDQIKGGKAIGTSLSGLTNNEIASLYNLSEVELFGEKPKEGEANAVSDSTNLTQIDSTKTIVK